MRQNKTIWCIDLPDDYWYAKRQLQMPGQWLPGSHASSREFRTKRRCWNVARQAPTGSLITRLTRNATQWHEKTWEVIAPGVFKYVQTVHSPVVALTTPVDHIEWVRRDLLEALQALAASNEWQCSLPLTHGFGVSCIFYQYFLSLREYRNLEITTPEMACSTEQNAVLKELKKQLSGMWTSGSKSIFENQLVRETDWWERVRILARRALELFSWPIEPPPATYFSNFMCN